MNKKAGLIVIVIFSLTIVTAIGYNDPFLPKLNAAETKTIAFNNNSGSTNTSVYWGNYLYTDYDLVTGKTFWYNQTQGAINYCVSNASATYVKKSGDTMTGILNMNANIFLQASNLILGTGYIYGSGANSYMTISGDDIYLVGYGNVITIDNFGGLVDIAGTIFRVTTETPTWLDGNLSVMKNSYFNNSLCDNNNCYNLSELNKTSQGNVSFNQSLTEILYAKYNFTNNNFNGSGNFTTTGYGTLGTLQVGSGSQAISTTCTAIGANSYCDGTGFAVNGNATIEGISIGTSAISTNRNIAIGRISISNSTSPVNPSIAIGQSAWGTASFSTCIGTNSKCSGTSSIGLGNGASAFATNSIGIGTNVKGNASKQIIIGNTYTGSALDLDSVIFAITNKLMLLNTQNSTIYWNLNHYGQNITNVSSMFSTFINNSDNVYIGQNLSVKRPYWNGYDNSTQPFFNTANAQIINVSNNADFDSYGIRIVGRQNVTFDMTGDYMCILSPEFFQNSGGTALITFWYQLCTAGTCTDAKWSNSRYSLANNQYDAPAIPFQFDITSPSTQAVRFMWWSDNTGSQIYSSGDLTSPTRPSIPGIILNCNKISEVTP